MIEYNSRLNNFFGCTVVQSLTHKLAKIKAEKRYSISISGKFHEISPICPNCNSRRILHNGNDRCKSRIIKELGFIIKRGKCLCKNCKHTWTTYYADLELFVKHYKQLIYTEVFSLCTNGVSLDKISEHILRVFSKKISYEWIRKLYLKASRNIEQKKVLDTSGIFNYDEQWIEVNGKKYFRVVVIDAVKKLVIFDETVENSKLETLKDKLNMKMLPYHKEAFIVDLARGYPKMLKDLFPNVRIQWCIFHLNQLIVRDFESYKKKNKQGKKFLPLLELSNLYRMLNLFFNHEVECNFLERQLKQLAKRKEIIKGCGCYEESHEIISDYEMQLIYDFNEFRKGLKKNRRKHRFKFLLRHSKEDTMELLNKLEQERGFFPKKLQARIKKIRENIDKFTLFQENPLVPPTNNTVEQYYSATLQKTEKKRFRMLESAELKLKLVRERWNGTLTEIKFSFFTFLQLFARVARLFAPT
ncbi:MAG: hypothetical protein ABIB71_00715 [Candidatus Woesearchaeota archaeon]